MGRDDTEVETVRVEILELAPAFAEAAQRSLVDSLGRAVERLIGANAAWFNGLTDEQVASLRRSAEETIRRSAAQIAEELEDQDLWLAPSVLLEQREEHEEYVWSRNPFIFVPVDVKVVSHVEHDMPARDVDNPFNRVWIHISNGADRLDGVLKEFGLPPKADPDWGGGHYGLQPQTADELDPSGTLEKLWKRYVKLYRKLHHAEDESWAPSYLKATSRDQALERWRRS